MVETAIGLPIFLIIILGLMWWGITRNQKQTFDYALNLAPRAAMPRGDQAVVGSEIIASVQEWTTNGGPIPTALRPLLATTAEANNAFGSSDWYMAQWNAELGIGGNVRLVPPTYIYALVYFYQTLKQGVGQAVRFPCDPTDPETGAGCAQCGNINSSRSSPLTAIPPPSGPPPPPSLFINSSSYNRRYVGIWCQYRPDNVLVRPIMGLFSLLTGQGGQNMVLFSGVGQYKLELDSTSDINPFTP